MSGTPISVTIDGTTVTVAEGTMLIDAAHEAGVDIPRLCYTQDLEPLGTCGMCMVQIEGIPDYKRACITEAQNGMKVLTNTAELRKIKRGLLELILAAHPEDCLKCIKHGKCELQELADRMEVRTLRFDQYTHGLPVDSSAAGIMRDMNKCIGCGRCISVCHDVQSVKAIDFQLRGSETIVSPGHDATMGTSTCVNCGQCVVYCPVGALYEKELIETVWDEIGNPQRTVVAQIAPAVRVALGEEFGMEPGTLVIGKIYAALKKLGIDTVFDTNFSADLTIMEEGTELLHRIQKGGPLPLITSCSPGWIKFGETFFPDLIDNLSSCKSPQQMLGALIKTCYAKSKNLDPASIVSLSIMPCTAKKYESARPEMNASGFRDVDYVLTTRELARMIRQAGIDFSRLDEIPADPMLSGYSGAGTIFGATGGVMEAALRTAYELQTGKTLDAIEFESVRGLDGVKRASVHLDGTEVRVAVASGLGNARELMMEVEKARRSGELPYHFIEIMACTGGCVGGGGQPLRNGMEERTRRIEGLYTEDKNRTIRKSHENPEVLGLYREFLKEPGSDIAHSLLHTHYRDRSGRIDEIPAKERVS
ncbi:MAG: NADH-dependent [FeFe] hydrogenase, group A6 [Spirochaetota bacterium]